MGRRTRCALTAAVAPLASGAGAGSGTGEVPRSDTVTWEGSVGGAEPGFGVLALDSILVAVLPVLFLLLGGVWGKLAPLGGKPA